MVSCCVSTCKNRSDKKKEPGSVTYHKFPKNPAKTQEWVEAIGRPLWAPGKSSRICSAHFYPHQLNKTYASGVVKVRDDAVPLLQLPGNGNPVVIQTGYLLFTGKKQDVGTTNSDKEVAKSKQKSTETSLKTGVRGRRRKRLKVEAPEDVEPKAASNSCTEKEEEVENVRHILASDALDENIELIQDGNLIDIESGNSSDLDDLSINVKKEHNYDKDYFDEDVFSPDVDIIVSEGKLESNFRKVENYKLEEMNPQEKTIDTTDKNEHEFLICEEGTPESSGKENSDVELNSDTSFIEKTNSTEKHGGDRVEHQKSVLLSQRRTNTKRKVQMRKSSQSLKGRVWAHKKRKDLGKKMFEKCSKVPKSDKPLRESNQLKAESDVKKEKTDDHGGPYIVLAPCSNPVSWLMVQDNQPKPCETEKPEGFTPRITTAALITASKPLPIPPTHIPLPQPAGYTPPILKPGETYVERNLKYQLNCIKDKLSNKRKQIKTLHQQNRRLKTRLTQTKGTLKECQKKLRERLKEKLTWNNLPDLGKDIFELHKENKHLKTSFPEQVKHFSMELYRLSTNAYKLVREAFPSLPHPRTICKWYFKNSESKRIEAEDVVVEFEEAAQIHGDNAVSAEDSLIPYNSPEESYLEFLGQEPCTTIQEEIEIEEEDIEICKERAAENEILLDLQDDSLDDQPLHPDELQEHAIEVIISD